MDIYSPADSFVIRVKPNGLVKVGEELIVLSSPELDKQIKRVESHQEELRVTERKYHDGRKQEWQKLQEDLLEQLKIELQCQRWLHKTVTDRFDAGIVIEDALVNATLELAAAERAFVEQKLTVAQFEREMKDATDQLDSKNKYAQIEKERLLNLNSKLTIIAPFKGDFQARCARDLFYGANECLGVLNAWA